MADALLQFTTFTDDTILFQDKAAANAFFAACKILGATPTTAGVVKQAATVAYTQETDSAAVAANLTIVGESGIETTYLLVQKADFDDLVTRFNTVSAALANLVANLKSSGALA